MKCVPFPHLHTGTPAADFHPMAKVETPSAGPQTYERVCSHLVFFFPFSSLSSFSLYLLPASVFMIFQIEERC